VTHAFVLLLQHKQPLSPNADVNLARLFLVCLLLAVPVILLVDGPIVQGLVAASLAAGILIVGASMRPGEAEFLLVVVRPLIAFSFIPILWMVVQILPVPASGWAHPIWQSAEQALGHPMRGSISIDPGATLLALAQYLCALAVAILAAAVAVDRARADWVLFALVAATALVALTMIGHEFLGLNFGNAGSTDRGQLRSGVALGIIVSAAAAIRTFERYETGTLRPRRSAVIAIRTLVACAVALVLCLIALAFDHSGNIWFCVACGLGTLLLVPAIRQIGLGFWGCLAIAAIGTSVAIGFIANEPAIRSTDLTLAFAVNKAGPLLSTTQRMLADAPWTGTGAGTFAALVPIYREAGDVITGATAPTTASEVSIELGRPALWAIVVIVAIEIFVLLRGALDRGRDSFYPAAGAGSLLLLLLLSFCDAGVINLPVGLCAAAIVGLAFAQRRSRTIS
jgi:hypothetical protein